MLSAEPKIKVIKLDVGEDEEKEKKSRKNVTQDKSVAHKKRKKERSQPSV